MKTNNNTPFPLRILRLALLLLLLGSSQAKSADRVAATVAITNTSVETLCAEEDNVAVGLIHPAVAEFALEARPPAYPVAVDSTAPNFQNCSPNSSDPVFIFQNSRRVTLLDTGLTVVVAERFPTYWRSNEVAIKVGATVVTGMHTLTLYRKISGVASWPQCLVLYCADGNLRLKPHPPTNIPDNVFGASVLLGPITNQLRPVVNISFVEYIPASDSLVMTLEQGGTVTLRIKEVSRNRFSANVSLNTRLTPNQPFAMLRSMYAGYGTNCDTEFGSSRLSITNNWQSEAILQFSAKRAAEVLFSRSSQPQVHNRSAPDIWFGNFTTLLPGLRIEAKNDLVKVVCPLWTISDFDLESTDNLRLPVWHLESAPMLRGTDTYEVILPPPQFGSSAFFRLRLK